MKLRRITTAAAAVVLTSTAFVSPAQAQGLDPIDEVLNNLTCGQVFDGIHFLALYEDDHDLSKTTRSELSRNIRDLNQSELSTFFAGVLNPIELSLVQSQIANSVAGKALDCGFVDEDPATLRGSSPPLDGLPLLEALSSKFV